MLLLYYTCITSVIQQHPTVCDCNTAFILFYRIKVGGALHRHLQPTKETTSDTSTPSSLSRDQDRENISEIIGEF